MSGHASGSSNDTEVEELHILGTPVALDVDRKPGPDGVGVRVYASPARSVEAVRIATGTLDLLLFDGVYDPRDTNATPLMRESYPANQLRRYENKTVIGICYNFVPIWGVKTPTKGRVTVIAIYKSGNHRVASSPITIPMGDMGH